MLLRDAERDIRGFSKYSRLKLAENRDTVRGQSHAEKLLVFPRMWIRVSPLEFRTEPKESIKPRDHDL